MINFLEMDSGSHVRTQSKKKRNLSYGYLWRIAQMEDRMDLPTALRMFMNKSKMVRGVSFEVRFPDKKSVILARKARAVRFFCGFY